MWDYLVLTHLVTIIRQKLFILCEYKKVKFLISEYFKYISLLVKSLNESNATKCTLVV